MGREDPLSETPDQPRGTLSEARDGRLDVASTPGLRERAEKMAASIELRAGHEASPELALGAFHELRVHQIELEMQNEELRRTQQELLQSVARYQDLYDSAPVGYVTVDEDAQIKEANLTSAGILGVTKGALVGLPFTHFVLAEDQDIFYLLRRRLFESRASQLCSLRLSKPGREPFPVQLVVCLSQDLEGVLEARVTIVLVDEDGAVRT